MPVQVKICGITTDEAMDAAIEAGADLVGLVFYPPSPRALTPESAALLTELLPPEIIKVGLFVDADDDWLDQVMSETRIDLIQCHGSESPERIEAIRLEYGVPVMKMIPAGPDLDRVAQPYFEAADWLLFDAPPQALPGGNGVSFDWSVLAGRSWPLPWMLAGGLTPENVADAIRLTGATAVDVSSGVESSPGVKDPDKIRAFIRAAKGMV